jgi:DNA-binding NtrC family response regulator
MLHDGMILVVDRSEDMRELLAKALTIDGYRVETTAKGITALQMIFEGKVDVVIVDKEIMDIEIEKFMQTCRLKAAQVPVVVITARTSSELEKEMRKNRVFYYAIKPFSLEIMKTVIRDAFKNRRNQRIWTGEELRHFRVLTRNLTIDALGVLNEIKYECEDRLGSEGIPNGHEAAPRGLPRCGWTELMEKLHLLEQYLEYTRRISEGKI